MGGNKILIVEDSPAIAEMVRDNLLEVSGLLVHKLGGASARPLQPAGYYAHLNFPQRKYVADKGEGLYRRGVYTHWQRMFVHPAMLAFDAPTREECIAERPVSNTPLAALVLLNDPSYVEAAQAFTKKAVKIMMFTFDLMKRTDIIPVLCSIKK